MDDNVTTAVIEFENGDVVEFEFLKDKAPMTCENFIKLAKRGFYDGLIFHRVIEGFMIQGGCPLGNGTGGPGYTINAEFNDTKHVPGVVSMARSRDPNSAGSQFFICVGESPHLDGQYTAFGRVTKGYDVVEKISKVKVNLQDRPIEPVVMKKVYVK
ncbi:peptidylprolyl isomerase [bacterium]|nr:peptidylprolyl isomerase [bacterium]